MAFGAVVKKIQYVTAEESASNAIASTTLTGGGADFDTVSDVSKTELRIQEVEGGTTQPNYSRGRSAAAHMTATDSITVYYSSAYSGVKVRWCLQIIEYY